MGERPAIVLAHGFTGSLHRPALQRAADALSGEGAVLTFSFRGHGRSGGRSTVGDKEVLDLQAVVDLAGRLGHREVVTVGFSMGGSVVLRHAALWQERERERGPLPGGEGPLVGAEGVRLAGVVSVSAPARWYYRGTAPMRRLHWMVMRPEGRLVGRLGFRTRIHGTDWDPVPASPVESVPYIAPVPLLLVHGDSDPYFPLDHPRSLAEAAGPGGELWVVPGMGHAENAAGQETLARVAGWIGRLGATGASGSEPRGAAGRE